jgi:hypothetical protein
MRFEAGGPKRATARSWSLLAYQLFTRATALFALSLAVASMARISGIGDFSPSRFDLMEPAWRAACVTLVVFCSAAGFGLWSLARWGNVIWLAAALLQIAMHTLYASIFGANPVLVSVLLSVLALQAALYFASHAKEFAILSKR